VKFCFSSLCFVYGRPIVHFRRHGRGSHGWRGMPRRRRKLGGWTPLPETVLIFFIIFFFVRSELAICLLLKVYFLSAFVF